MVAFSLGVEGRGSFVIFLMNSEDYLRSADVRAGGVFSGKSDPYMIDNCALRFEPVLMAQKAALPEDVILLSFICWNSCIRYTSL